MLERNQVTDADLDMSTDAMRAEPRPGKLRRAGGFQVWRATTDKGAICIGRVPTRKMAKRIAGEFDWIEAPR